MDRLISHEEVRDLLGAFALNATSDEETTVVAAHVEQCADCHEQVAGYFDIAAAIGGAHPTPPSPAIWDRVLLTIRADDEAVVSSSLRTGVSAVRSEVLATAPPRVVNLDAHHRARRSWRMSVVALAAAAAVAIPFSLRLHAQPDLSLTALASRAASSRTAKHFTLKGPNGEKLASAVLTEDGTGYVLDSHLPSLPTGRTYQLWAIAAKNAPVVSAGVLGAGPRTAAFTVTGGAATLAITVEPEGGSVVATTAPIATGTVY